MIIEKHDNSNWWFIGDLQDNTRERHLSLIHHSHDFHLYT